MFTQDTIFQDITTDRGDKAKGDITKGLSWIRLGCTKATSLKNIIKIINLPLKSDLVFLFF